VAVPDAQHWCSLRLRLPRGSSFIIVAFAEDGGREVEALGRVDEDLVDLDEDGGAQLGGLGRVRVDVDGGRAPADVVVALEDGDVDREVGGGGVLADVVGG